VEDEGHVDDDIRGAVTDEIVRAGTPRGRWYAEYIGRSYRVAVDQALTLVERAPASVLKTDLWNECLGGERDVLGHLWKAGRQALFGVDRSLAACSLGRERVPGALVVQADITLLPFRTGSLDAVLDLSTLDHLSEEGMARAIGEYRRVLRDGGAVLLVFWRQGLLMRMRVLCKRLLGLRERSNQRYFACERVKASLGAGLAVVDEFVAGTLLLAPHRLTGLLSTAVSTERLTRFVGRLIGIERGRAARPLLRRIAGLCGLVAIKNRAGKSG
jgi:SAM-dependent methyltransferase